MEPRTFNGKQKQALIKASQGFCTLCRTPLKTGWHADHIIPYSKGGKTDVTNGQALCATCNLKKGNKTMITLRDWQEKALFSVIQHLKNTTKSDNFLTHATPGGGKTVHALSVAERLISKGDITKIIIIAPSVNLVDQWAKEANNLYNFNLKKGMLYKDRSDFNEYDGIIMTYASVVNYDEDLKIFCDRNEVLVVADEIHHVAESASWGKAFKTAFGETKYKLMLTGTPWASNKDKIPFVTYNDDGFVIPNFTYGKASAITNHVCRATEFLRYEPTELPYEDISSGIMTTYKDGEAAEKDGKTAWYSDVNKTIIHMKKLFIDADERLTLLRKQTMNTAGGLLIAGDIKTAHKFQDEIKALTGVEYPIVHSKMEKSQDAINKFKASNERWLISVNMVSEGVDINRLQVCVFLSFAKTELYFRQVVGRIERRRTKENLGDVDKSAYFYYTKHDEINEYVKTMEEENEAGKAALDEIIEAKEKTGEATSERIPKYLLHDFETARAGLISRGIEYNTDIVEKAFMLSKSINNNDMSLTQICKILMVQEGVHAVKYVEEIGYKRTLDEQKKEIRLRMNKEIKFKMAQISIPKHIMGKAFKRANTHLNKKVDIQGVDDDCSLAQLEKRLEYIYSTEDARAWFR